MQYLAGLMFLLGLMPPAALAGEVYRWVDEKGVVHYSDRATTSGAQVVPLKTGPANSRVPEPGDQAAPSQAPAGKLQSTAEIRAEECAKAQKRLESYRQADQLLLTGSDGEQRDATPDERIQAIVRAETQAQAFCTP